MASSALTAEDRLEIAELVAKFSHYSDYCDWERLAGLFTDDVVTTMSGIPHGYTGPEEQVKHARISAEGTNGKNRHYNYNLFIEADRDEVVAVYMFSNVNAGDEVFKPQAVVSGRMRDTVVKTPVGWRIARRHVEFDQKVSFDF